MVLTLLACLRVYWLLNVATRLHSISLPLPPRVSIIFPFACFVSSLLQAMPSCVVSIYVGIVEVQPKESPLLCFLPLFGFCCGGAVEMQGGDEFRWCRGRKADRGRKAGRLRGRVLSFLYWYKSSYTNSPSISFLVHKFRAVDGDEFVWTGFHTKVFSNENKCITLVERRKHIVEREKRIHRILKEVRTRQHHISSKQQSRLLEPTLPISTLYPLQFPRPWLHHWLSSNATSVVTVILERFSVEVASEITIHRFEAQTLGTFADRFPHDSILPSNPSVALLLDASLHHHLIVLQRLCQLWERLEGMLVQS